MASNSPQASAIIGGPYGILSSKASQPGQNFSAIGSLFATSALSEQSPYLNLGSRTPGYQQMNFGITDWEYEALPAQLLPLLRPDSIAALTPTNGGWNLQFSGADGYVYVTQTSTNLADWHSIATNQPAQGTVALPVNPGASAPNQFYRTVLLPQ
jgi:hypothetical protein